MKMVDINGTEHDIHKFMTDSNPLLDNRVDMVKAALSFDFKVPLMSQQAVALSVAKLVAKRKG